MDILIIIMGTCCSQRDDKQKVPKDGIKETPTGDGAKVTANNIEKKAEPAKASTQSEPAKTEPAKTEPAKKEPAKTEPANTEPAKTEPAKTEPVKTEPANIEPAKTEPAKMEQFKIEQIKTEPVKVQEPEVDAVTQTLTNVLGQGKQRSEIDRNRLKSSDSVAIGRPGRFCEVHQYAGVDARHDQISDWIGVHASRGNA